MTFLEEGTLITTPELTSIESTRQRRGVLCYIPLAACSLPPPPSLLVACRSPRSPPAFMPRYCHTNSKQSICIMCNLTEEDVAQRIQAQPHNFQSCFPGSAELPPPPPPPAPLEAAGNAGAQASPVVSASEQTIRGFKISTARDTTMTLFITGPSTNTLAVLQSWSQQGASRRIQ